MSEKPLTTFSLRPLEKADLDIITTWFQNVGDLALFDRTARIPLNSDQTEGSWKGVFTSGATHDKCWFVIESDTGDPVGLAGLEGISNVNRDAVVAIFVAKAARRLGVGIRATALLADFGFRQLGLNRLTSYYRADNNSSRDLVAKVGCQVEGTMRQAWFADGQYHDMVVVGVLQSDWLKHRKLLAQQLTGGAVVSFGTGGNGSLSWPPQDFDQ